MARNRIYPIVQCHRVVGSNFSLVGYGGRINLQALRAKLHRLKSECRGFKPMKIRVGDMEFQVYPTEKVIENTKLA